MEKMAPPGRRTVRSVADDLAEDACRFDFYQAVRILEMLLPDREPVGEGADPAREPVRFRSDVSLTFPASEITEVRAGEDGQPARMRVGFMGLAGATGPLPAAYTELILERVWRRDTALKDFLDIFNHRLVSLMYRVARTQRIDFPPLTGGRPDLERSRFARALFALMGLRTGGLRNRMKVKDRSLLFYTGIVAQNPRSMTGLETILSDYFQVTVRGRPFAGKWYGLEAEQVTRLGRSGQNRALGTTAMIGTRVWDQQGKFELRLGPLTLDRLLGFLPKGTAFIPLCQMTRFYVGRESDYDIVLALDREESVRLPLGTGRAPRLGRTSWLSIGGRPADYSEVRLAACTITREERAHEP